MTASLPETCTACGDTLPDGQPAGVCPRCRQSARGSGAMATVDFHRQASTAPADPGGKPGAARPRGEVSRDELEAALRDLELVTEDQWDRLVRSVFGPPADLAQGLVRLKVLSAYQAELLLQGRAKELLVGPYLVVSKLGAGGMGVVFRVKHRMTGRNYALKSLPPAVAGDAHALERFEREFRVASRLRHPNIVSAIEAGRDGDVRYFTMDYVAGHDLESLILRGGPMDLRLALHCALQVARGLEAAHAQGVIHRDIKPGNIMIDGAGAVRLLDLGLARVTGAAPGFGSTVAGNTLTQSGAYLGTVDFLAPEQADDPRLADARSDIYSLACTLYFLLTGKPPFHEESVVKRLMAHQQRPAPSLRAARPDVPEPLDAFYLEMMAKKPRERPQSMTEVISALESFAAHDDATGTISVDLETFARTALKRAPRKERRGFDASVFQRPDPDEGGLSFDPDLNLEDVVAGVRKDVAQKPLDASVLPPKAYVPPRPRARRRRVNPIPVGAIGLLGALGAGAWLYLGRGEDAPRPIATTPAPVPELATAPSPPVSAKAETGVAKQSPPPATIEPKLGRILFYDDFTAPSKSWPHESAAQRKKAAPYHRGVADGVYQIDVFNRQSWLFSSLGQKPPAEFTVEMLARLRSENPIGKTSLTLNIDYPGGQNFRANAWDDGRLAITFRPGDKQPTVISYETPPGFIKNGMTDFTKITMHISKQRAEVFVNGQRVGKPVELAWTDPPKNISIGGATSRSKGSLRCEIDSFELRELDTLPTP